MCEFRVWSEGRKIMGPNSEGGFMTFGGPIAKRGLSIVHFNVRKIGTGYLDPLDFLLQKLRDILNLN